MLLTGTNKWSSTGTGSATVQGSTFKEGSKALKVTGTNYVLKRDFTTLEKQLWLDLQVKPNKRTLTTLPTINSTMTSGFYFDSTGKLNIYDGTSKSWQTVMQNGVDTNQWQRVTIYQDFNTQKFSAWINGVRVAENFGFANARTTFSKLQIEPGNADAFIDQLSIKLTEPTGLDNDGDGLLNSEEIILGTDLNNADTDGDDISDKEELLYNTNPLNKNEYPDFPIAENFDQDQLNRNIRDKPFWTSSLGGEAIVNSGGFNSPQFLNLSARGDREYIVERGVSGSRQVRWIDFYIKPEILEGAVKITSDVAIAFYVNSQKNIVVYDGIVGHWKTIRTTKIDINDWTRVTINSDYVTQKFSLWINNIRLVSDIGFANPKSSMSFIRFSTFGGTSKLDQLEGTDREPYGLDNDGDGFTNAEEIILGTNPNNADSDADGIPDKYEVDRKLNPLVKNSGLDQDQDGLTDSLEYLLGSNLFLKDTDGDSFDDFEEWIAKTSLIDASSKPDTRGPLNWKIAAIGGAKSPKVFQVGETIRMGAFGNGINSNRDQIGFLYQEIIGDFQLTINLSEFDFKTGSYWSRFGLMARENLDPDSKFVSGDIFNYNYNDYKLYYIYLQYRNTIGSFTNQNAIHGEWFSPMLVQMKRKGDRFTYLISFDDGKTWKLIGEYDQKMTKNILVGVSSDSAYTANCFRTGFKIEEFKKDLDQDGLWDDDEVLIYHTDPAKSDTDGDGISDGVEINHLKGNPTVFDPISNWVTVSTINGASSIPIKGTWAIDGEGMTNKGLNGSLKFFLKVKENGIYRLSSLFQRVSDKDYNVDKSYAFRAYLDGEYIGRKIISSADISSINWYTPYLKSGDHELVLYWDNVYYNRFIRILNTSLQKPLPNSYQNLDL